MKSNDIEPHITWLLTKLEPVAEKISEMLNRASSYERPVIILFVVRETKVGRISLTGELLKRVVSLCDRLDIDLWPVG